MDCSINVGTHSILNNFKEILSYTVPLKNKIQIKDINLESKNFKL